MSDFKSPTETAKQWIVYAQEDLRTSAVLLETDRVLTKQICYHSQQSAEKAIKAGLIFSQIEFPFVHNLDELRDLLPREWDCVEAYPDLAKLTSWAVDGRYPGLSEEPSEESAKASFQQASGVLASIEKDLVQRGFKLEE